MDLIYTEMDKGTENDRRAIATMAVDLSKAFNRLDHSKLLAILFDL